MEATNGTPGRREIDLHRRVCMITRDVIEVRPARSAAVVPLIGFFLGVAAFVSVVFLIESLPFFLVLLLMGGAILLVPFSGMGFVYSVYGANVVFNREKRTALWQQGLFGMGVGTEELVPFEKIERFEVAEIRSEEDEFVQFEITLLKKSERVLSLGQITVPIDMYKEGLARASEVAEAASALTGKPVQLPGARSAPGRPRRRRRRRRKNSASTVA